MKECVLVTGGAGYIGSHVVLELQKSGYRTLVYDNLSTGHSERIIGNDFVEGDVHDIQKLRGVFRDYRVDAVMHFAAFIEAGESMRAPEKYFFNNTSGSFALLEAMSLEKIPFFIFSSTAAVYGQPTSIPIREDHDLVPINAYGQSKLAVEQALPFFSNAHGIRFVALRYFNAAGADPEVRTGESHLPESHLIPIALQAADGILPSLTLFGIDYDTKDGSCVRDFISVTDLARAHVLALDYLIQGGQNDVFNLGSETGYTVREVVSAAEAITGKSIKVIEAPRRAGDPARLIASSEKIRRVLGWHPQTSDLKEILLTAWGWHKKLSKEGFYLKNPKFFAE